MNWEARGFLLIIPIHMPAVIRSRGVLLSSFQLVTALFALRLQLGLTFSNRYATSALGIYKLVSYQSLHVRQIDVCFVSFEIVLYSLLSSVDNEIDMS